MVVYKPWHKILFQHFLLLLFMKKWQPSEKSSSSLVIISAQNPWKWRFQRKPVMEPVWLLLSLQRCIHLLHKEAEIVKTAGALSTATFLNPPFTLNWALITWLQLPRQYRELRSQELRSRIEIWAWIVKQKLLKVNIQIYRFIKKN